MNPMGITQANARLKEAKEALAAMETASTFADLESSLRFASFSLQTASTQSWNRAQRASKRARNGSVASNTFARKTRFSRISIKLATVTNILSPGAPLAPLSGPKAYTRASRPFPANQTTSRCQRT